jgi:hypothetical protein
MLCKQASAILHRLSTNDCVKTKPEVATAAETVSSEWTERAKLNYQNKYWGADNFCGEILRNKVLEMSFHVTQVKSQNLWN